MSALKAKIIGVLHLPALPGSPRFAGSTAEIRDRMLVDASTLVEAGVRAMILENYGDTPFFPRSVPPHTIAQMTALAAELKRKFEISLGINVLRNDGCAALSIAHAVGAEFIRVNVLCGARVTDQGLVEGIAHDLLRLRQTLGAEAIRIFADVRVKHSAPLAELPLAQEVADLIHRGGADAVIVTGSGTGEPVDQIELEQVKNAADSASVFLGSGVTAENLADYLAVADGAIVGSWLKRDGVATNPVDPARAGKLVEASNNTI